MNPPTDDDLKRDFLKALANNDPVTARTLTVEADRRDAQKATTSLHSAALWYAEQGLNVFPLSPGSKIPLKGSGGCKDGTTDVDMVDKWWTGNPNLNIGIATGHLVDVVDIDGALGQQSRAHNWPMFEALTVLGTVLTPRPGGMHLYVPAKPGISNGAGLLPGVDYRGDGGYVVAPPSVNEQGSYRWLRPIDVAALLEVAA